MSEERKNGEIRLEPEKEVDKTFGERLYLLRKEKDFSMEEVGRVIGVSKSTINKYEKFVNEPTMRTANKLAKFFGVSIDYMIGLSERREHEEDTYRRLFRSFSKQDKQDIIQYMKWKKSKI